MTVLTRAGAGRRHLVRPASAKARREARAFYAFASPWIIGFIGLSLLPTLLAIAMGFTNWSLLTAPEWVGLANYQRLVEDPVMWQSLWNTIYFTVGSVGLGMITTFLTALLLNQEVRGVAVFRTIFYLPAVTSGVATALLWVNILDPNFGLVNYALGLLGIQGPGWLQSTDWAIPGLILMSVWGGGNTVVIYLAGLQGIPTTLYDAAHIDGAGIWRRFLHVTIPMMSPVIFFNLVTGTIASLQAYALVLIMTDGGPGNATLMFGLYIYRQAFQYFDIGYAAALSWVLFAMIMAVTAVQFIFAKRWVHYEVS